MNKKSDAGNIKDTVKKSNTGKKKDTENKRNTKKNGTENNRKVAVLRNTAHSVCYNASHGWGK